jgi:hypothetical protein
VVAGFHTEPGARRRFGPGRFATEIGDSPSTSSRPCCGGAGATADSAPRAGRLGRLYPLASDGEPVLGEATALAGFHPSRRLGGNGIQLSGGLAGSPPT